MNTFQRYLLSFLSMLILPVVVLVLIMSQIITGYCRNQLIASELLNLNQTRASLEMLSDQMSAYVSLSSQQTVFTAKELSEFGNMFAVRHFLAQWIAVSPAVTDIAFYNSKTDRFYTFDAAYSPEDYLIWREKIPDMDPVKFRSMLLSDNRRFWLTTADDVNGKNTVLFLNSVRISSSEFLWLIFHFDPEALSSLIAESERPDEQAVLVYADDGRLLYAVGKQPSDTVCRICLDEGAEEGTYQDMQYARVNAGNGLILMSIAPKAVVNAPLGRIWSYILAGFILVMALGGIGIMYAMHLNYVPIRNLEQDMLDTHTLPQQSADAVENLRQVFTSLKENQELIKKGQIALARDETVLKLINGHWLDLETFNTDAAKCGLSLHGPRWFLVQVRLHESAADENRMSRLTACAKAAFDKSCDTLYLELPENETVILIVSTNEQGTVPVQFLQEKLEKDGFSVSVSSTRSTHHLQRLHDLWSELQAKDTGRSSSQGQEEMLSLLQNALEFQEHDRAEFALHALCAKMEQSATYTHVYLVWRTVDVITRYLTRQQNVRKLTDMQSSFDRWFQISLNESGEDENIAETILSQLFFQEAAKDESTDQQMIRYLEDHIQDQSFTVQSLADSFSLSLSNASHYFKTHIGISISEYMENLRMNEARRLLLQTDDSIAAIAEKTGYTSSNSFLRVFKKTYGCTPSEYRRKECKI